jgi:hypothetical protein
MPDVIVERAQAAVQALFATHRGSATGQSIPVRTERNASPATAGMPTATPGGAVSASLRSSGFLGYEDEPSGSALNPKAQLGLFAKIRKESAWLRYTTFAPVSEKTGYLDTWDDRSFRMHPTASEGPRRNIPLHRPDVDQLSFSTKTMSGAFGIRLGAIRAAAKAGQDVNALVQRGIAAGIGNVLADLGINGDSSLPQDTDQNRQRSTVDGWFKRIRDNSSNYQSRADGFSYHNGIWAGMIQQIEKAYRTAPGLAWGVTDSLATRWLAELTATRSSPSNAHPSIVNDLGQTLLNAMGAQANPLGRTGIVIPQMEDDRFTTEGYSGTAPTSITNNGDGTLTINVNTLADSGVDRSSTGTDGQRYVIVGNTSTGVEERLAVDYAAPNNTVTTTSTLGQLSVSTTAADYYVKWADTQSVALGLWRFLALIVQNGMRVYSIFYPHDEVIEIVVHTDLDFLVADYDAFSLTDDVITPEFNILP